MIRLSEKQLSLCLKIICAWMFSFSAVSAFISLSVLKTSMLNVATLTAIFTILFFLIFHNKYTRIYSALALALVGIYIYYSLKNDNINVNLSNAIKYYKEVWRFVMGLLEYSESYNKSTLRFLAALVSFICVFLIKLKYNYIGLFIVGTGTFIAANIAAVDGMLPIFLLMIASLLILFVLGSENAADGLKGIKAVPICIFAIVLASLMPVPEKLLDRKFFENIYEEAYWVAREPFMPKYFSAGSIGLENNRGQLGGNLRFSKDFIMYVFAQRPLYLSGATKEIYTGTSWVSAHEGDFQPSQNINYYENNPQDIFVRAGWEYGASSEKSFEVLGISQRQLTINVGKARTGTIFKPDKSHEISFYGDYKVTQRGLDLRAEPVFNKEAIYYFDYIDIDYENSFIKQMLESSKRGYYRETANRLSIEEMDQGVIMGKTFAALQAIYFYENESSYYADYVYNNYTALPETLPERVYELAHNITADYENDYGKIEAIKRYLKSKTYSVTPGSVPANRDFVDYFLFDIDEGYCTYYATAMAVMARAIGIPSRYNEGYILPDTKVNDEYYEVYGTNAHAWAEIYYEGVGWVPVEATPSSFFQRYYQEAGIYYDDSYYLDEEMDYYASLDPSAYGASDGEEDVAEAFATIFAEAQATNSGMIITFTLGFSLFSYIMARKAIESRRHQVIRRSEPNVAGIEAFKGILELMGFYGMPIGACESALNYARRVGKLSPSGSVTFVNAAEIFSKARFAAGGISEAEADVLRKEYFFLYRRLEVGELRHKFLVHRYIKKL